MLCANWIHAARRLSSVKGVSRSSRIVVAAEEIAVGLDGPSRISRSESPIGRLVRLSVGATVGVDTETAGREVATGAADGGVNCVVGGTEVVTGWGAPG